MAIKVIQGPVTNVKMTTEVAVPQAGHFTVWTFHIGTNCTAVFKCPVSTNSSVSDGDMVMVAGNNEKVIFRAYALRNLTTNSVYKAPVEKCFNVGGVFAAFALFLFISAVIVPKYIIIIILFEFLPLPYAIYFLSLGMKMRSANIAIMEAAA